MNKLTKPSDILNTTDLYIDAVKNSLLSLNEACVNFIEIYDEHNFEFLKDSFLLKEKIKDTILKAVSNDEL